MSYGNKILAPRDNDESEDEFINVDEPDEMETETTDAQRLANELAVQSCKWAWLNYIVPKELTLTLTGAWPAIG